MRAPISVIIPTLNAAQTLPAVLASLVPGLDAGLIREVVISDGGSGDGTAAIAAEWGAHFLTGPASRGGQLRRGADAAAGQWLLFLHADTQLSDDWVDAVQAHLAMPDHAACFTLRFRASGFGARFVAAWANLRTDMFGLPYGDQALLMTRAAYDAAGGYPDQPLMEDVALVRALPQRPKRLLAQAWTGAERYVHDGWFRRGANNLGTLLRYFAGADPAELARRYQRKG